MRRTALLLLAVLAIVVLAGCIPDPPSDSSPGSTITREVLFMTNLDRQAIGEQGLTWDGTLAQNASDRSCQLASSMTHQDLSALFGQAGYESFTILGENILSGPVGITGLAVHNAFWNSPAHRAQMLDPRFNRVGIWTCVTTGGVFVAEEFGG